MIMNKPKPQRFQRLTLILAVLTFTFTASAYALASLKGEPKQTATDTSPQNQEARGCVPQDRC